MFSALLNTNLLPETTKRTVSVTVIKLVDYMFLCKTFKMAVINHTLNSVAIRCIVWNLADLVMSWVIPALAYLGINCNITIVYSL